MNKFIVTMAIAAIGFSSAAAILPGTPYRLELKDTELCISSNGEGAKLTQQAIGDAAYEQTFVFVEVPEGASAEGYNIKTESGLYIDCTSNAWDIKVKAAADLKKKDNIFIIEEDGDYIQIKCRKNDKYFGKDKTAAGSGIYCDKTGGSTMILKASPIDAASVKAALEKASHRQKSYWRILKKGKMRDNIRLRHVRLSVVPSIMPKRHLTATLTL